MEVAFIVKLNLPSDDPATLEETAHDMFESIHGDVVSVVPWSRDATQIVSQLISSGPPPTSLT